MKRTWRDAACEVAWNATKKYEDRYGVLIGRAFLQGIEMPNYCFTLFSGDHSPVKHECFDSETFPAFRAAFMKWLDENERSEG